jgi:hypothetical protein
MDAALAAEEVLNHIPSSMKPYPKRTTDSETEEVGSGLEYRPEQLVVYVGTVVVLVATRQFRSFMIL